jgi:hypothetical protein
LRTAAAAVVIDTDGKTYHETVATVEGVIRDRAARQEGERGGR